MRARSGTANKSHPKRGPMVNCTPREEGRQTTDSSSYKYFFQWNIFMLIRKIVLQPINLANAPKRSTDKIALPLARVEGHVIMSRGRGWARRTWGIEGECRSHAARNSIIHWPVPKSSLLASGQAGALGTGTGTLEMATNMSSWWWWLTLLWKSCCCGSVPLAKSIKRGWK